MKIIIKKNIPIKYLKDICYLRSRAWEYGFNGITKLNYWLSILYSSTDFIDRQCNWTALAIEDSRCIGFLEANINKRIVFPKPLLFFINIIVIFLLSLSKQGRGILKWKKIYLYHNKNTVELGKYILDDFGKVSEGLNVTIDPKYRKKGIYKEMINLLMKEIDGYLIFHTSTESVFQAHEKLGFKRLYEIPYPKFNGAETAFIMFSNKQEYFKNYT